MSSKSSVQMGLSKLVHCDWELEIFITEAHQPEESVSHMSSFWEMSTCVFLLKVTDEVISILCLSITFKEEIVGGVI